MRRLIAGIAVVGAILLACDLLTGAQYVQLVLGAFGLRLM
jgi:hypothetical protein